MSSDLNRHRTSTRFRRRFFLFIVTWIFCCVACALHINWMQNRTIAGLIELCTAITIINKTFSISTVCSYDELLFYLFTLVLGMIWLFFPSSVSFILFSWKYLASCLSLAMNVACKRRSHCMRCKGKYELFVFLSKCQPSVFIAAIGNLLICAMCVCVDVIRWNGNVTCDTKFGSKAIENGL